MGGIETGENIQTEGFNSDTEQEESSRTVVVQTESDKQSIDKVDEQEALNFVNQEKIAEATKKVKNENDRLINFDKIKGLINDSVFDLKLRTSEFASNVKKNISWSHIRKIAATSSLIVLFAACSTTKHDVVIAAPQEMTERAEEEQAQTQEAFVPTPTSEATLSPEEIREQRLNEIAEAVKANDYRFTVEELDEYLAKKGRINSIGSAIDKWKGSSAPFQYYFANDEDIGYLIYPAAYTQGSVMTLNDFTQNDIIMIVDEMKVGKIVGSIYGDLWVWHDGKADGSWENVPGKYTVVFYMTQELGENGELHDVMIPDIGGYFFENVEGKVKHVDYDDAVNKNLTDEEMEFFTDEVLASLKAQEGWIMFTLNEGGNLEEKSFNVKEFDNSIHPAT